ncbi:MAG TPA: hypothetical protein VGO93_01175, partial [Candidatus Xenobia bacterium]
APYLPSSLEAVVEGLALRGPEGALTSVSCAVASVFVQDKTKSNLLAVLVSTTTGAALAATTWPAAGLSGHVHNAVAGGLLGAFQTYRADKTADTRGAGSFGTLVAGPLLAGPSKVAAGIGAASAHHFVGDRPRLKPLVAAGVGGALGAGLAAVGFAPLAVIPISAAAAAAGTIVGPRYSQAFRNLSKTIGSGVERGLKRLGLIQNPLNPRLRNSIGAFPSGAAKEGVNGLVYADGHLIGLIAGAGMEIIHQVSVFAFSPSNHPQPNHVVHPATQFDVAGDDQAGGGEGLR